MIHDLKFLSHKPALQLLLVCTIFFAESSFAQVCNTVGPVTLATQAEVASFQADYGTPTCVTMTDDLTITGADITDLSPLGLTTVSVPGEFLITGNTSLANLNGLSLTSVYWLEVSDNSALTDISGLSAITNAGGPVIIRNNALLSNIDGLSGLSNLPGGALILQDNVSLTDLSGASGITSTGGSLVIQNNDALANLNALSGIVSVNGLSIVFNDNLTSISGLSNLTSVSNQSVYIRNNPLLASLAGLSGLTSVGGLVIDTNNALTELNPLSNLTNIGNATSLALFNNANLTDIDGLGNVEGVGFRVEVTGNTSLSQCNILARLLDQVDDFAPGPGPNVAGIADVGDTVTISGNLAGCNSVDDIVGAIPPPIPVGPVVPVPVLNSYALMMLLLMLVSLGLWGVRKQS